MDGPHELHEVGGGLAQPVATADQRQRGGDAGGDAFGRPDAPVAVQVQAPTAGGQRDRFLAGAEHGQRAGGPAAVTDHVDRDGGEARAGHGAGHRHRYQVAVVAEAVAEDGDRPAVPRRGAGGQEHGDVHVLAPPRRRRLAPRGGRGHVTIGAEEGARAEAAERDRADLGRRHQHQRQLHRLVERRGRIGGGLAAQLEAVELHARVDRAGAGGAEREAQGGRGPEVDDGSHLLEARRHALGGEDRHRGQVAARHPERLELVDDHALRGDALRRLAHQPRPRDGHERLAGLVDDPRGQHQGVAARLQQRPLRTRVERVPLRIPHELGEADRGGQRLRPERHDERGGPREALQRHRSGEPDADPRVDAPPIQLVEEPHLVAARGVDGAVGQREGHAAAGRLPGVRRGEPVRGEERLDLGRGRRPGRRPDAGHRQPQPEYQAGRQASGRGGHRPQRGC